MPRPRPIRSKADLALLLSSAAPSAACAKQIEEHNFVVLGGFSPPDGLPRCIVRVQSPFGKTWFVGVTIDEYGDVPFKSIWYHLESQLPWAYWDGDSAGENILVDGEEPAECAMKRMEA